MRATILFTILSVVAVNVSLAAIEICAFNAGIFGKSKASKPEVMSIYLEVVINVYYRVIGRVYSYIVAI